MTVTANDGTDTEDTVITVDIVDDNQPPRFTNLDDWMWVAEDTELVKNAANNNLCQVLMTSYN